MPTVAVVGATGFLGGHVSRALQRAGHQIIAPSRGDLTRLAETGRWDALGGGPPPAVVNCAGVTSGTLAELEAANVEQVATLLRALGGTGACLVQIGSAAEYGAGRPGVPIGEDHLERPVGDYGSTKLAGTRLVLDASRRGVVHAAVLRVFNPVGAGISDELLPGRAARLIAQALRDGGPVRMGPLDATRDFVDVRDVADAVVAAVAAPEIDGLVLNIGSGGGATARELVRLLAVAAGYRGAILEVPTGRPRQDDVPWQVADISRAAALLGWSPRRSLGDAVAQLWSSVAASATTSSSSAPS